ncbi:hypothetical protein [Burkholderia glumae]
MSVAITAIETAQAGFLNIPNVVWSGIVASLITVLGVLVTNRGLSKRHREQLEFTAKENAKAREMSLRKEVYIPAIESAIIACNAVGTLIDPASDVSKIAEKFNNAISNLGKVSAIAMPETVAKIGEFEISLRELHHFLLFARMPMMDAYNRWQAAENVRSQVTDDHRRWIDAHLQSLLNPATSKEQMALFRQQIDFLSASMARWESEGESAKREMQKHQIGLIQEIIPRSWPSIQATNDAAISIRAEFSLAGDDLSAIKSSYERNSKKTVESVQQLVQNLISYQEDQNRTLVDK